MSRLDELSMNELDFQWVEQCTSIPRIEKALSMLKDEPYEDLIEAAKRKRDELYSRCALDVMQQTRLSFFLFFFCCFVSDFSFCLQSGQAKAG